MLNTTNKSDSEVENYLRITILQLGSKNTLREPSILEFFKHINLESYKEYVNIYTKIKRIPFDILKPQDILKVINIISEKEEDLETICYIIMKLDTFPVLTRIVSLQYLSISKDKETVLQVLSSIIKKDIHCIELYKTLCLIKVLCTYDNFNIINNDKFYIKSDFECFEYQEDYILIHGYNTESLSDSDDESNKEKEEKEDNKKKFDTYYNIVKGVNFSKLNESINKLVKNNNVFGEYWIYGIYNNTEYKIEQNTKIKDDVIKSKNFFTNQDYLVLCGVLCFNEPYLDEEINDFLHKEILLGCCSEISNNMYHFSTDFLENLRIQVNKYLFIYSFDEKELEIIRECYIKIDFYFNL